MAQEAAQLANSAVNYANYDNDSDGYVDAFIVIHAGQGAEVTGNNHDIWSHKWVLPSAYAADGKSVYAYFTVPDDANVGVCAHELGHLLFGFPDLYDTDSSSAGIGNWCLMAGGSWNNGGKTPAHPMAWCKLKQNWVSVSNITANSATPANIKDIKSNYLAYRLWKNGASGNEYFLVENRQKTGFDSYLPAPGLLIWHIDDSIASNSNEAHYKVALEQADGKKDLEHNVNRGDAGDPFPGSSVNRNFKDTTNPNSKSYAGTGTCVEVKEISDPATIMTAKFSVSCIVKPKKEHFKELKKENFKDVKDHQKEIFMDKHYDKIKDKSEKENYEKRIDKVVDGRPGDFGKKNFSLEERILQLEERVNYLAEPFIGQILRPDLSQGAFLNEEGFSPESGETGTIMSGDEKVQFDTK
jgi:immune inhibitor A